MTMKVAIEGRRAVFGRNGRLARVNGDFADGLLLRDERNGWRDGRPPAIAIDSVGW